MSMLYRPSKWVRDAKTGKMVRSNPGTPVELRLTTKIKSQINGFAGRT